jgi:hypothetical protein
MTSPCCEKDERAPVSDQEPAPCCGTGASEEAAPPCCERAEQQAAKAESCCGTVAPTRDAPYRQVPVEGRISTLAGEVPRVAAHWSLGDWLGRVLVRLGFRRMSYAIAPGLYAVGRPGANAPVLVTANYKLTFDVLRRAIAGLDAWVLVLDTKGVNVWCAAGKGTLGSAELAARVESTRLAQVVRHRRLDRLEVAGLELAQAGRAMVALSVLVLAVTAWNGTTFSQASAWESSAAVLLASWGGVLAGTVLFAALLPWLPGRMFAVKGAVLGLVLAAVQGELGSGLLPDGAPAVLPWALGLLTIAISSYLAANYTGSTTFTSLSGVKRELEVSIPAMAGALIVAAILPGAALVLERIVR